MSQLFPLRGALIAIFGPLVLAASVGAAEAARVRGSIRDREVPVSGRLLGFTRTRVAPPVPSATRMERAAAVFLAVKDGDSLPIPTPTEHQIITLEGLKFSPSIAACASDAQVSFVNADREPVTLTIDGKELGTIGPGAQKTYVCSPGEATRVVRVRQWPHMRAMVYVGEVGVAGVVDDRGRFTIEAPRGTYELKLIAIDGVVRTRDVKVDKRDVDLGVLEMGPAAGSPPPSE